MTEVTLPAMEIRRPDLSAGHIRRRYAAERRFRSYGILAICIAVAMLAFLVTNIVTKGYSAFFQTYIGLNVRLDSQQIDPENTADPEVLGRFNYQGLINSALYEAFPDVRGRRAKRSLRGIVSKGAGLDLRDQILENPGLIGQETAVWVRSSDDIDVFVKEQMSEISHEAGIGSVSFDGPKLSFSSTADLAPVLDTLRDVLRTQLFRLDDNLAGLQRREDALSQQLSSDLPSADHRKELETGLKITRTEKTQLTAEIAALTKRIHGNQGAGALNETLPSFYVAANGGLIKLTSVTADTAEGVVLTPLSSEATANAGTWELQTYATPEADRRVKDIEVAWISQLSRADDVETRFNAAFFTSGDSREPELAGIQGALVGSLLTLTVTLLISFPVGVLAAVYLEEFAPKNRLTDIIEVNINNLAAVPSIVFGLLGLAVFINFFGLPRSAPLVGGLVLALMTLPTIIIASRAALKAVPPSIREAALGVGASRLQTITHHVLPLAMPGILTGTIIGMAQALGETAPLLMIGMVAFIVDIPSGFTDAATVLPVQIFIWADSPERAFVAKTSAAIMVLLGFLILMNALAVLLRKRFERRW